MSLLRSRVFLASYERAQPGFHRRHVQLMKNLMESRQVLLEKQGKDLSTILEYAVEAIPYYRGVSLPTDCSPMELLSLFPVMEKGEMKDKRHFLVNPELVSDSVQGTTGGSTGMPFQYRMSKLDYYLGKNLLYRGFARAGYELGDKLFVFGGGSLTQKRNSIKTRLFDFLCNMSHVSTISLDDLEIAAIVRRLFLEKRVFVRGYATSLYNIAHWALTNGFKFDGQIRAAFSTAEMLLPQCREVIEEGFNCKVYNQYGLHDGGVTAFECCHGSMHIDTERSLLEVVDEGNRPVFGKLGRILATSFHNRATAFIRYDTGDLGVIEREVCKCGDSRLVLSQLAGRATDFVEINGKKLGAPALTVLMGKIAEVDNYQLVFSRDGKVTLRYISRDGLSATSQSLIEQFLNTHIGAVSLTYMRVRHFESIIKHKFIMQED